MLSNPLNMRKMSRIYDHFKAEADALTTLLKKSRAPLGLISQRNERNPLNMLKIAALLATSKCSSPIPSLRLEVLEMSWVLAVSAETHPPVCSMCRELRTKKKRSPHYVPAGVYVTCRHVAPRDVSCLRSRVVVSAKPFFFLSALCLFPSTSFSAVRLIMPAVSCAL